MVGIDQSEQRHPLTDPHPRLQWLAFIGFRRGGAHQYARKRRTHHLLRLHRHQRLMARLSVSLFHLGDLTVFTTPAVQRSLQFILRGGQIQPLRLSLLSQRVDFHSGYDAALKQGAGIFQVGLGVRQADTRVIQGASRPRHLLTLFPMLHVLHRALRF